MNKADVVRFELDQAENRVELCKVRRRLLINSLLTVHLAASSLLGCK